VSGVGPGKEARLARLGTMGVQALRVARRRVRILAARDQQHRHGREPADMIDGRELPEAHAQTALGHPDDAAAEAMKPRRISPTDARAERRIEVMVHALEYDSLKLGQARRGIA